MDQLEKFREAFPHTRVSVFETDMVYYFRNMRTAKFYEKLAQRIILEKGLRLTADLQIWARGGVIFEICLVVELVPEMHLVEA